MARTRLVAGNWKMHGSRAANRALVDAILRGLPKGTQSAVCPPFPYLALIAGIVKGSPVALGAQNCAEKVEGAYTGEVSPRMLADGTANKNIAWQLQISEHTVKFHVAQILTKLNAGTRTEAVTIGIRKGLIMV